jgi:enamine deaminase RidA (YjgF/YER057c/UK114 family)
LKMRSSEHPLLHKGKNKMPAKPVDANAPVAIFPPTEPKPNAPYSPAVKAGGWVFVAGQLATDFKNGIAPEVSSNNPFLGYPLEVESRCILQKLQSTVAAAGCDLRKDVLRIWQWMTSDQPTPEEFAAGSNWAGRSIWPYVAARDDFISEPRPASTGMGVRELAVRGASMGVDLICAADGDQSVGIAAPAGMPVPVAGYSPALRHGDWIFLAGDLATDWAGDFYAPTSSGAANAVAKEAQVNPFFWYGSPIEQQTDYTLRKLNAMAEAAGTSLDRTVKAEIYIGHPIDFAGMDKVWKRWFPVEPPARVVIPYMGLAGRGCRVEIALTLLAKEAKSQKTTIETTKAPKPFGHEPQAIRAGNFLFFSQQMPFDSSGKLAQGLVRDDAFPWYGSPGREQMRYMMNNVSAICEAAGTQLSNVVRMVSFHDNTQLFGESLDEWAAHFPGIKPAATLIKVGGPLLVPGANSLLDLIAYVPS